MNAQTPIFALDPTKSTYLSLVQAYDYLNSELWAGKLPACLVTLQRKANCHGYFAGDRFATRDGLITIRARSSPPSPTRWRISNSTISASPAKGPTTIGNGPR
jgi:hypothetical protein